MKVVWSEDARQHLRSAYNYIRRESPQNAKKISSDITDITNSLLLNQNKYAPDKFKYRMMEATAPSKNIDTELYIGYLKKK